MLAPYRLLSASLSMLPAHWQLKYGHPIYLAETFVECERFRGTCYRAANWSWLGQTQGRGRNNDYEPLPKWRNAARRPSCQDAITLLRKQIEAKPLCQGTPTNILGYPSMIQTAAA